MSTNRPIKTVEKLDDDDERKRNQEREWQIKKKFKYTHHWIYVFDA